MKRLFSRCLARRRTIGAAPGGDVWFVIFGNETRHAAPPPPPGAFVIAAAPRAVTADVVWIRAELEEPTGLAIESLSEYATNWMAGRSATALLGAKRLLTGRGGLEQRLERERRLFPEFFRDPDRAEGIAAFLEKRPPRFATATTSSLG